MVPGILAGKTSLEESHFASKTETGYSRSMGKEFTGDIYFRTDVDQRNRLA
jgi:hypothetical protein